ncbi:MAG: RpiB/LacA/LacB family sugar-phosphate isomerase [Planctomycetes bacterium]|nr:RpiB/LacA/LacB family sugar-phosphate isomerase [Planctomycetota bacterium]
MYGNELYIGCDDAALSFKEELKAFLKAKGYDVEDVGIHALGDPRTYPEIAAKMATLIAADGYARRGILICGTGIGMAMAANKFPGIRAAQVHDSFSAERAALSNDANVITMGARVIGVELGKKLALEWLQREFKPGPSSVKIEAIKNIEQSNFK